MTPTEIIKKVNNLALKYNIRCLSAIYNIQGTVDIEVDTNIYLIFADYEAERLEDEIRKAIPNVNDIYSQDFR